ncbi:23S rRNA (adenine(2503)-C(2))-methyltransferase RlmN [Halobacteriovorax sp. JY17]|uniref:23S rRNA (adenine(2503)-C(2))-methyltransferase RlmN n=1 Tax=Halobacteriovorax sp. JY17 TaxID=2014617 RepID=UPI000C4F46A3|nr:23S rRNA (adenine(2503)-C(2))-methyltransferase RlmN [Halobacteriovorax sp. JY17]PIK13578.1 MAG: 23S rRNA (adenine(2503)-C(2))-methyltransferase RlmN [Halobacteriovorax sp. JY17]
MKKSFYNLNFEDLENILRENGLNTSAASLLFNWHYKKKVIAPCTVDISKKTLNFLEENLSFELPQIDIVHESSDRTVKFLFKLHDGSKVETVLIPFHGKYSICLSSQVGCAMNCSFCFTGTQGLKRNLDTSEIVGQFLVAWNWLVQNREEGGRILNIVFMGQGEPLHNFDVVKKACDIFLSKNGASIGNQKITVSTSGFIPGLKRWSEESLDVNLALSLHSPFTEKRNELIPINKKYPLEEVLSYIDTIPLRRKQFITYEYLLIKDFNDQEIDARKTGELLKGKEAFINLIPFNPFPGSEYQRPSEDIVENFKLILKEYMIPTLVRTTKGDDVLAACGQLNSKS